MRARQHHLQRPAPRRQAAHVLAQLERGGDHLVEGEHVVVQVAVVRSERHGVARLHRVHELHERAHVVLVVVDHVGGVAFEPPADARVGRGMGAEREVDRPVPRHEVAQRPAGDLGVVGVEERDAVALDHDRRVVDVAAELVERDAQRADLDRLAVRKAAHVAKADRLQVATAAQRRLVGNQHRLAGEELAQARAVPMVPVLVAEDDRVHRGHLALVEHGAREVPPRPPVARADQPRVDDHAGPAAAHPHRGVRQDPELHGHHCACGGWPTSPAEPTTRIPMGMPIAGTCE